MVFREINTARGTSVTSGGVRISVGKRVLFRLGMDVIEATDFACGDRIAALIGRGPDAGHIRLTKSAQGFKVFTAGKGRCLYLGIARSKFDRPPIAARHVDCEWSVDEQGNGILITLPDAPAQLEAAQ